MGFIFGGISDRGPLYTGGILTGFYGIGYGIEFNDFTKIFGKSKGKKHGKNPHEKETEHRYITYKLCSFFLNLSTGEHEQNRERE